MSSSPKVIIMAGGTGGHIFPALAVAKGLLAKGWIVHWLGSKNGMEERLVPTSTIAMHLVSVSGLRGKGIMGWLKAPFVLAKAVFESIAILRKNNIQIAIGFGGFASGPGGIATSFCPTQLMLHEQNAVAGMTNKRLALVAKTIYEGFPNTFTGVKKEKVHTVGNPVRIEILAIDKMVPTHSKVRVLVIGGSRGALALNENLAKVFNPLLTENIIEVWHQTGSGKLEETTRKYQSHPDLRVAEFISEMDKAYQWADLIICRAGASTVAEIAAVGLPAILVPYPHAVDDHQTENAKWLADNGGALIVPQSQLENGQVQSIVDWLQLSPQALFQLGQKNKAQAFRNATQQIVDGCEALRREAA